MTPPVFHLRDAHQPDSYWPHDYINGALPHLDRWGWLARPATQDDKNAAAHVLDNLNDVGLDVTDVFPFGLLWALRARGVLTAVAGLDDQLRDWRQWEETDHVGEPLDFLPPF